MSKRKRSGPPDGIEGLLQELFADAERSGSPISKKMLAEAADVVPSAVTGWLNGRQPRDAQLDKIAGTFSGGDRSREVELRARLYQAVERSPPTSVAAIDRARTRADLVNIGVVEYNPPVSEFFRSLATAFASFCGFVPKIIPVNFADLERRIGDGQIDIGFGLWETPGRLRNLNFIGTPLAVGMALITLDDSDRFKGGDKQVRSEELAPIMHRHQAVFDFALDVFGLARKDIQMCAYEPRLLARTLLQRHEEAAEDSASKKAVVVITDELMALATVRELLNIQVDAGGGAKLPTLVTALDEVDWLRDDAPVAGFPRYNVSICTRRPLDGSQMRASDLEWFSYVEDAWRIFLRGNMRYVGKRLKDLYDALKDEVDAVSALARSPVFDISAAGLNLDGLLREAFVPVSEIHYHNSDIWHVIISESGFPRKAESNEK